MPEQMVKELSFSGIANKVASSIYKIYKLEFSFANMHESQDRSAGKGGGYFINSSLLLPPASDT